VRTRVIKKLIAKIFKGEEQRKRQLQVGASSTQERAVKKKAKTSRSPRRPYKQTGETKKKNNREEKKKLANPKP